MSESPQAPPSPVDDLLQIPTRATLTSDLERLASASSLDQPLSILWIDVDKLSRSMTCMATKQETRSCKASPPSYERCVQERASLTATAEMKLSFCLRTTLRTKPLR
jgi:hypothetical protein